MSVAIAVLCVAISFFAATVQGSIGLGYGLLATPFLAMIDTAFIPGAVLIAITPMSISIALGSRTEVDPHGVGWAVAGRIPGVVAGAAVVGAVSSSTLAIGLACAVLGAVALSIWGPAVHVTPHRTVGAGAVSGFMATATGVGGPPMALLFQRSAPATVRATLSAYFAIGALLSLTALGVSGQLAGRQWRLGLLLLPGVIVGLKASPWVRRHVDGPRFRPALLAVCAGSAVALLVKQL